MSGAGVGFGTFMGQEHRSHSLWDKLPPRKLCHMLWHI